MSIYLAIHADCRNAFAVLLFDIWTVELCAWCMNIQLESTCLVIVVISYLIIYFYEPLLFNKKIYSGMNLVLHGCFYVLCLLMCHTLHVEIGCVLDWLLAVHTV